MPTRKQRRKAQKERRHDYEYETVWVDPDTGEEVDPPEDYVAEPPEKRDTARSRPKAKTPQQRGGRATRVPPPPSWQRAAKRAGILGAVVFVFIYLVGAKKGGHNPASALLLSLIYTALFIPFQFTIDRFAYNRWQRRGDAQAASRAAKKR